MQNTADHREADHREATTTKIGDQLVDQPGGDKLESVVQQSDGHGQEEVARQGSAAVDETATGVGDSTGQYTPPHPEASQASRRDELTMAWQNAADPGEATITQTDDQPADDEDPADEDRASDKQSANKEHPSDPPKPIRMSDVTNEMVREYISEHDDAAGALSGRCPTPGETAVLMSRVVAAHNAKIRSTNDAKPADDAGADHTSEGDAADAVDDGGADIVEIKDLEAAPMIGGDPGADAGDMLAQLVALPREVDETARQGLKVQAKIAVDGLPLYDDGIIVVASHQVTVEMPSRLVLVYRVGSTQAKDDKQWRPTDLVAATTYINLKGVMGRIEVGGNDETVTLTMTVSRRHIHHTTHARNKKRMQQEGTWHASLESFGNPQPDTTAEETAICITFPKSKANPAHAALFTGTLKRAQEAASSDPTSLWFRDGNVGIGLCDTGTMLQEEDRPHMPRAKLGSLPAVVHFGDATERSVVFSYALLSEDEHDGKLARTLAGLGFRGWALADPKMMEDGRPKGYVFVVMPKQPESAAGEDGEAAPDGNDGASADADDVIKQVMPRIGDLVHLRVQALRIVDPQDWSTADQKKQSIRQHLINTIRSMSQREITRTEVEEGGGADDEQLVRVSTMLIGMLFTREQWSHREDQVAQTQRALAWARDLGTDVSGDTFGTRVASWVERHVDEVTRIGADADEDDGSRGWAAVRIDGPAALRQPGRYFFAARTPREGTAGGGSRPAIFAIAHQDASKVASFAQDESTAVDIAIDVTLSDINSRSGMAVVRAMTQSVNGRPAPGTLNPRAASISRYLLDFKAPSSSADVVDMFELFPGLDALAKGTHPADALRAQHARLDPSQKEAFDSLATCEHGVRFIDAFAGTGKSSFLRLVLAAALSRPLASIPPAPQQPDGKWADRRWLSQRLDGRSPRAVLVAETNDTVRESIDTWDVLRKEMADGGRHSLPAMHYLGTVDRELTTLLRELGLRASDASNATTTATTTSTGTAAVDAAEARTDDDAEADAAAAEAIRDAFAAYLDTGSREAHEASFGRHCAAKLKQLFDRHALPPHSGLAVCLAALAEGGRDGAMYAEHVGDAIRECRDAMLAQLGKERLFACTPAALYTWASKPKPVDGGHRGDDRAEAPAIGLLDIAIVEEATRLSEPAALMPLIMNSPLATIFVGDTRQLWHMVKSAEAYRSTNAATRTVNPFAAQLSMPITVRAAKAGAPIQRLRFNWRAFGDVAEEASRLFYGRELTTRQPATPQCKKLYEFFAAVGGRLGKSKRAPPAAGPTVVISMSSLEERVGTSITNARHCGVAVHLIRELFRWNIASAKDAGRRASVMVVCAYEAQQRAVQQLLGTLSNKEYLKPAVSVETFDSAQGKEADVVIVDFVRNSNVIGFLSDPKRINVALTRCRMGMALLLDETVVRDKRRVGGHTDTSTLARVFNSHVKKGAVVKVTGYEKFDNLCLKCHYFHSKTDAQCVDSQCRVCGKRHHYSKCPRVGVVSHQLRVDTAPPTATHAASSATGGNAGTESSATKGDKSRAPEQAAIASGLMSADDAASYLAALQQAENSGGDDAGAWDAAPQQAENSGGNFAGAWDAGQIGKAATTNGADTTTQDVIPHDGSAADVISGDWSGW
jgi:AAA domain-containing protein